MGRLTTACLLLCVWGFLLPGSCVHGQPEGFGGQLGTLPGAIGNLIGMLTGAVTSGKVYPFPIECEAELRPQCKGVVKVCKHGEPCNLECQAEKPPVISDKCKKAHPCAVAAETWCAKLEDADALFDCLQKNHGKLSAACLKSEPCLDPNSEGCKIALAREWGGGSRSVHGSTGLRHVQPECQCHSERGCSTHLHHPFCRPCGESCVENPLCGMDKQWCRVQDSEKCNASFAHRLDHCDGPFLQHPHCERAIQNALDKAPHHDRCEIQARAHKADPTLCPRVNSLHDEVPEEYRNIKIRQCNKKPMSLGSFMRDIFFGHHPHPHHHIMPYENRIANDMKAFSDAPVPPPMFPLRRMIVPPPPPLLDGRPWMRPHRARMAMRGPSPMLRSEIDAAESTLDALKQEKKVLRREERLAEQQMQQSKDVAAELALERKEIDRERKEVEVERKTLNPKSAWTTMTKLTVANAGGAGTPGSKSGAVSLRVKKKMKWAVTVLAIFVLLWF